MAVSLGSSMDFTCNVDDGKLLQKIHLLSLPVLPDNVSPYLLPSRLQVITCILVGDNMGIGFLVRRVAPSGENEEGNEK